MIADGYCHDDTNDIFCSFDGGDCCLSSPNTVTCSDCVCSSTGVITSPGWQGVDENMVFIHEPYDIDVDMSWNIQVPSGQLIEIVFLVMSIGFNHDFCE